MSRSARSPSKLGAIRKKHTSDPKCLARGTCLYLQPTGDRITTTLPTESQRYSASGLFEQVLHLNDVRTELSVIKNKNERSYLRTFCEGRGTFVYEGTGFYEGTKVPSYFFCYTSLAVKLRPILSSACRSRMGLSSTRRFEVKKVRVG